MMKKNMFFVVILVLAAGFSACTGLSNPSKSRKGWTLEWEDDFNSKKGLAAWSKIPRSEKPMNRLMSDRDDLYELKDGMLILRGGEMSENSARYDFLTSGITRQGVGKNSVRRIEVRARLNLNYGFPFISLQPSDGTENISIDFMERYYKETFIFQSVTSPYTYQNVMEEIPDNPPSNALIEMDPLQFHIYGVEIYPDSIVFFVDNKRTMTYPRILTDRPDQFPFNEQDLDLFIGTRFSYRSMSKIEMRMYIDWVRYYKPKKTNIAQ